MPKAIKTDHLKYMSNDEWRILTAVEMGMKNHELVPVELIHRISKVKQRGNSFVRILKDSLGPASLVSYEAAGKKCHGYRLTNMGYDYLALHQLIKSGQISDLGSIIGAGKESDVYLALAGDQCGLTASANEEQDPVDKEEGGRPEFGDAIVIKFHRLGRTSFRKVKEKREYHQHRVSCSWLYLDRLAAVREFSMMKALFSAGLPVPRPLACNRNAVVMSYLEEAVPLSRLAASVLLTQPAIAHHLFSRAADLIISMANLGLVHGDFNEFNLLVYGLADPQLQQEEVVDHQRTEVGIYLIDFPQMISRDHPTAQGIYSRDRDGLLDYFGKFIDPPEDSVPPKLLTDISRKAYVDVELRAPGYRRPGHDQDRDGDDSCLLGRVAHLEAQGGEDGSSCSSGSSDEREDEVGANDQVAGTSAAATDSPASDTDDDDTSSEEVHEESDKVPGVAAPQNTIQCTGDGDRRHHSKRVVITPGYVRERRRAERRQEEQQKFHARLRRQQRSQQKQHNRDDVRVQMTLFA